MKHLYGSDNIEPSVSEKESYTLHYLEVHNIEYFAKTAMSIASLKDGLLKRDTAIAFGFLIHENSIGVMSEDISFQTYLSYKDVHTFETLCVSSSEAVCASIVWKAFVNFVDPECIGSLSLQEKGKCSKHLNCSDLDPLKYGKTFAIIQEQVRQKSNSHQEVILSKVDETMYYCKFTKIFQPFWHWISILKQFCLVAIEFWVFIPLFFSTIILLKTFTIRNGCEFLKQVFVSFLSVFCGILIIFVYTCFMLYLRVFEYVRVVLGIYNRLLSIELVWKFVYTFLLLVASSLFLVFFRICLGASAQLMPHVHKKSREKGKKAAIKKSFTRNYVLSIASVVGVSQVFTDLHQSDIRNKRTLIVLIITIVLTVLLVYQCKNVIVRVSVDWLYPDTDTPSIASTEVGWQY